MRDFRLPPLALFSDVTQRLLVVVTDVSRQHICPILKGQLTLVLINEDGTNRPSRNVGSYQSTLRNIPEE